MTPKITFRWSFIYQQEIHTSGKEDEFDEWEKYVNDFIKKISTEWQNIEKKVLSFIEKLTGLKWNENKIICYVIKVSEFGPISDPLTIPIQFKDKKKVYTLTNKRFIDILIHELIHNLFIQNKSVDTYFNYLIKKYKNYSWNTAIHVPVHAIHKEIFEKFFDSERFQEELKACSYYPEYKKTWDIVQKESSKKIINELRQFLLRNNK